MKLLLDSGEEGQATSFDGRVLTLLSPRAFAPGSPIRFSLSVGNGCPALDGRTLGSKRVDPECFEVRLRLVSLRRADRELLLRELG